MLKWDYKLRVDLFRQIHDLCTDGCVPKQLMIMAFDFHNCHVKNDFEQCTFLLCCVRNKSENKYIFGSIGCISMHDQNIADLWWAYQPWKLDENIKNRINCFYLCTILSTLGWSLQFFVLMLQWCISNVSCDLWCF